MRYDAVAHHLYGYHCDGLIDAVKKAAKLAKYPPDHPMHDYEPYYGDLTGRAVWQAKFVMREARRLGLVDGFDVIVRMLAEDAGVLVKK